MSAPRRRLRGAHYDLPAGSPAPPLVAPRPATFALVDAQQLAIELGVYQQVATRRYIDEQAVWALMRFADEPAERAPSRQITRLQYGDPRGSGGVAKGAFDQALERLESDDDDHD